MVWIVLAVAIGHCHFLACGHERIRVQEGHRNTKKILNDATSKPIFIPESNQRIPALLIGLSNVLPDK